MYVFMYMFMYMYIVWLAILYSAPPISLPPFRPPRSSPPISFRPFRFPHSSSSSLHHHPVIVFDLAVSCTPTHMGWLLNDRSLLQNVVSFIGLFCKRDLSI